MLGGFMIRTGFGGIVWYSTVKYSIVAIVRAVRNNTGSCSSIWGDSWFTA